MARAQRLGRYWAWLPAFRAVAEAEHLPTAAATLHVSPSALSRSIRLLEDALGQPLFTRAGRRMALNPAGRRFLDAVRDAMRLVDEGERSVAEARFIGPLRVAVPAPLAPDLIFPVLPTIRAAWPGIVPILVPTAGPDIPGRLLAGDLDLALALGTVAAAPALTIRRAGTITHGVFCGPGHPLYEVPDPAAEVVGAHGFVAPSPDDHGVPRDAWPADLPRTVPVRAEHMQLGVDLCRAGQLLAVLPDLVGRRAALRRLPHAPLPERPLDLVHRRSLPQPTPTEEVAAVLLDHISSPTR